MVREVLIVCAAIGAAVVTGCAPAQTAQPDLSGWNEAVVIVRDLDAWQDTMIEVAGWQVRESGSVDAGLLAHWGLDPAVSGREIVMGQGERDTGWIRFVMLDGVEQDEIRPNDQIWETGGIFNLNLRAADIAATEQALTERNWTAVSDPVEFTFGPFRVAEWIARGPEGVRFAIIERMEPPLEGFDDLEKLSFAFNSTQIVPDIEESLAFYRDQLGFQVYLEHRGASDEEGANVLGLPNEFTDDIERSVYILHPQGENLGSIELLQFHGASGRDFSARAQPWNYGIGALRFPVRNIEDFANRLETTGIDLATPINTLRLAPYGEVRMFAVRAPSGAWLEFYEHGD